MEITTQPTAAQAHPALSDRRDQARAVAPATSDAAARVALITGVCGLLADLVYVLGQAVPLGDVGGAIVASLFGPLIAGASFALFLLLASERPTLAGQMAAVANVAAGALVTAMLLVQLAVDDIEAELSPTVHDGLKHIEFGLDLSWDVFLVAGTILFGCAMLANRRFGRLFGLTGIAVALALYVLNFVSFPTPPADSGSVDLGPLVGLWYAAVSIQALRLWRVRRRRAAGVAPPVTRR